MRKCIVCSEEIKECMGFVLVGDIINKRNTVREICGKCGLMVLDMDEKQLNKKMGEWKGQK